MQPIIRRLREHNIFSGHKEKLLKVDNKDPDLPFLEKPRHEGPFF